jgi:hypothetical protein
MRPEISNLVRETVYPRLIDHETTKHLPAVVGMRRNVFWLDHESIEGPSADRHQRSHSNIWEAEMTHALVRHIVRQGVYSSSDIAVLTLYTGQLQKLREKMRNDFEIVLSEGDQETLARDGFNEETTLPEGEQANSGSGRKPLEKKKLSEMLMVGTVDNFQGEEAQIIIVSLVRSNKEKKVGFLRTTNRINVPAHPRPRPSPSLDPSPASNNSSSSSGSSCSSFGCSSSSPANCSYQQPTVEDGQQWTQARNWRTTSQLTGPPEKRRKGPGRPLGSTKAAKNTKDIQDGFKGLYE